MSRYQNPTWSLFLLLCVCEADVRTRVEKPILSPLILSLSIQCSLLFLRAPILPTKICTYLNTSLNNNIIQICLIAWHNRKIQRVINLPDSSWKMALLHLPRVTEDGFITFSMITVLPGLEQGVVRVVSIPI